jgi:hypothetical protein
LATTPTISRMTDPRRSVAPGSNRLPSARSPAKKRVAKALFTIATGGDVALSSIVKSRPSTMVVNSVAK